MSETGNNDMINNNKQSMTIDDNNVNQLFSTLKPFILKLDQQVMAVRHSQQQLYDQLSALLSILEQIKQYPDDDDGGGGEEKRNAAGNQSAVFVYPKRITGDTNDISIDIEEKSRRLLCLKRRLTLVHSILQTVNSRVKKLLLAHDSRILRQQQQQSCD